jgi:hypothetical protein
MKTTGWILIGAVLWANHAVAEGTWNVDGHSFTNVHAWQQGGEVCVSGRVSGGTAKTPLRSWVHVRGDDGRSYKALIRIERFTGQGETFETRFKASKASKWWRIERVEVAGTNPDKQRQADRPVHGARQRKREPPARLALAPPTSFPIKTESRHDIPRVLFSANATACLTVREQGNGRLVVMKNVAPDVQSEIRLPTGEYTAHVVGEGFDFKKRFAVVRGAERVEINLFAEGAE